MPTAKPLSSIVLGTPGVAKRQSPSQKPTDGGDTIHYAPMSTPFFATALDRMEYAMGLKRGDLDDMQVSMDPSICFQISADLRAGCATRWTIFPEKRSLMKRVYEVFCSNRLAPVEKRVDIRDVIQPAMFTYHFFFQDGLDLRTKDGEPVVSGKTRVTSSIHPCICPLLFTMGTVRLMEPSQYSALVQLREDIFLIPLPMTFVEQKKLPKRALPIAWIDPASKASEVLKNKPAEGSSLPMGLEELLEIADIDLREWEEEWEEEEWEEEEEEEEGKN